MMNYWKIVELQRRENQIGASRRGFTLLEVLVSMVVLGTAITGMFSLLSGSVRNLHKVEATSRAAMLGRSKMNDLLITRGLTRGAGSELISGSRSVAGGRWDEFTRWEAQATWNPEVPEASGLQVIPVRIDLTVYWREDEGREENRLLLETRQLWTKASVEAVR